MAQIELHLHTKWLIPRQNNNGKIKNCCNPRGAVPEPRAPGRAGSGCHWCPLPSVRASTPVPLSSLPPSPQLSSAAKPQFHRQATGKKTSNHFLFFRHDFRSPQCWEHRAGRAPLAQLSPAQGALMAKAAVAGDKSQIQPHSKGQPCPEWPRQRARLHPKPCHSALWGLQQEKCAAALPGNRRFTQWGKKKQLEIKKVIVLWLKCHLTPKSTTWK